MWRNAANARGHLDPSMTSCCRARRRDPPMASPSARRPEASAIGAVRPSLRLARRAGVRPSRP
eukprot:628937-Pyramimonas_sp.AAC.1